MEVVISLLNKLTLLLLILSVLVVIRHVFLLFRNVISSEPKKYTLTKSELIYLGLSISYTITCVIKGIIL
mgnify:CR=1 FL=1